jgi:hypothetical protein
MYFTADIVNFISASVILIVFLLSLPSFYYINAEPSIILPSLLLFRVQCTKVTK